MENTSKALIMAAEVLVGVMIISIAVYLFSEFSKTSAQTNKKIEDTQIAQFNEQFLKFYGKTKVEVTNNAGQVIGEKEEDIKCTIHDIVGLANLAKKNNAQYGLEGENAHSDSTLYIQIDIQGEKTKIEKCTNDELIKLIKENDIVITTNSENKQEAQVKYYKCSSYIINNNTKRVNYMKFVEI